jgi:pimeloyl-ACP methyl ester carboxylesterase
MVKVFKSEKGKNLVFKSYNKLLSLWKVKYEEIDIPTKYGITHAVISGDKNKKPLVLFHGVGDNSALMWIYNAEELSKHFYLIAIDTIGGPGKSIPDENYNKEFKQHLWINDILNFLKLKKVDITGVSNGSYLAYNYTAKEPGRVNKIVCIAGGIITNPMDVFFNMMRAFLPEVLFPCDKNIMKLLKKLSSPSVNPGIFIPEMFEHFKLLLKYFNNRSMMFHRMNKCSDNEVDLIREKSLFLIGDNDILSNTKKNIDFLKSSKIDYKIVKNAGHGTNYEQKEFVNNEMIRFFQ